MSDAERIAAAIEMLYRSYRSEGIGPWLHRRRPHIGARTPLEVLASGDIDLFVVLCEATLDMVAT